jgi:hypothetical protein
MTVEDVRCDVGGTELAGDNKFFCETGNEDLQLGKVFLHMAKTAARNLRVFCDRNV